MYNSWSLTHVKFKPKKIKTDVICLPFACSFFFKLKAWIFSELGSDTLGGA